MNLDDTPPRIQEPWTPDLDAILIAERAKNKTCAEIGALIGRTKNAVIGRASRLMIEGKLEAGKVQNIVRKPRADGFADWRQAANAKRRAETEKTRAMRILRAMDAPPPVVGEKAPVYAERFQEGYEGQHGRIGIVDLTLTTCRFPITQSTGETRYCGDTVRPGSAYCEDHAQRCFAVPAPRRLGRWRYT